mmetsp:Transcript_12219/g.49077  ORF Transcript_12219/g.49077 Transcript_12219/m.49077 type:complete len:107 (-) Transcript_12219:331-651(-)
MAHLLAACLTVAGAALASRPAMRAWTAFKNRPRPPPYKRYRGGFEAKMSRNEAALILGVRQSVSAEKIKAAHRKLMVLNHPDRGGSPFIATKVNEAKELLTKENAG